MTPVVKTLLEILGGAISVGALLYLRRSGCLIKKKPNSCDCAIQADLDGDGHNDMEMKVCVKEEHFSSEEEKL